MVMTTSGKERVSNIGRSAREALAMIRQAFGEGSTSRTQTGEEGSREQARHCLCHEDIVHEEFVLTSPTINSAHYCDLNGECVKMCEYVKTWGFHGSDYEECHLLKCYAVWLL
jgi:hypothetical protein